MKYVLRIFLPLALLTAGFLGRNYLIATGPQLTAQEPVVFAPMVEIAIVQPQTTRVQLIAYGEVRPRATTSIVAEVAARVLEVSPQLYRGSYVTAGEVLIRLDDSDFKNAVAMASAEVQKAEAGLLLEEAEARVSIADWQQLGEGPVPSLVAREPQLAAASAARQAALANLDIAKTSLGRTEIRAPFDGRSLQRNVEEGAWVAPGVMLATIYATDAAEVTLPIAASQLHQLGLKVDGSAEPLRVTFDTQVGDRLATWQGHVVRTEASVDPGTRMITAIAQIDAPFHLGADGSPTLAPGMFLRATIAGRELSDVYRIPRSALLDGDMVRIVDENDLAHEIAVQVAYRGIADCIISGGLEPGQRLIVSTLPLFVEGMSVVVMAETTGDEQ